MRSSEDVLNELRRDLIVSDPELVADQLIALGIDHGYRERFVESLSEEGIIGFIWKWGAHPLEWHPNLGRILLSGFSGAGARPISLQDILTLLEYLDSSREEYELFVQSDLKKRVEEDGVMIIGISNPGKAARRLIKECFVIGISAKALAGRLSNPLLAFNMLVEEGNIEAGDVIPAMMVISETEGVGAFGNLLELFMEEAEGCPTGAITEGTTLARIGTIMHATEEEILRLMALFVKYWGAYKKSLLEEEEIEE